MKIKLDDKHYLNCDEWCYWITVTVQAKSDKSYEKRVSGYMPTFGGAVDTFIEKKIKTAKITDLTELVKVIEELKAEVKGWKCAVERGNKNGRN